MRKNEVLLVALLAGTAVVQGCIVAAVGAGAGTSAYVMGDLKAFESKDVETVYNAALKAMDELELSVTTKTKDALSAKIVGRDAQDKKVTIKISATGEGTTKISIRVGMVGSETKSQLIYEQIKKHL